LQTSSDSLLDPSNYVYTGEGTEYSGDITSEESAEFACGYPYVNSWAQQYFVALNAPQWEEGTNCGRCVKVSCVDPRCEGQPDIVAHVIDKCPECKYGDLDFGLTAWTDITGMTPDRVQIAWNWTSCHRQIDGNIQFNVKDGTNRYWQAFFFSNVRYRPQTVTLNGSPLKQSSTNFWVHDDEMPEAPYTFTLTNYGGSSVTFEVDDILEGGQEVDAQFKAYWQGRAGSSKKPKLAEAIWRRA
jgi:hypothetical protein